MKPPVFTGMTYTNVPLSGYTTWKVGGPSDWLFIPETMQDLVTILTWIHDHSLPWFILGKGSNVLFQDSGFRGAVIILGKQFSGIKFTENAVIAGASASLSVLAQEAADRGLSGLEALSGIPGTVGGAGFVNAGAFNQSILEKCIGVDGVYSSGETKHLTDIRWGYRSGAFPSDFIITGLHLTLTSGDPVEIHQLMKQYLERRRLTQPLSDASAGCTFKNPEGNGAGRLIDRLGLKGFQIGRAMISQKHANFIINSGGASASEIVSLMRHVRSKVSNRWGVNLEPEVVIISEDGRQLCLEEIP